MLSHSEQLERRGVELLAVGFSPPDALTALADHLGWPFRFLSDVDRVLYRRLGLGRAGVRQVWSKGTRAIYQQARREGAEIRLPVEDPLQLGGDAVIVRGTVAFLHRPASPDDRIDPGVLVARALEVADREAGGTSP